MVQNLGGCGLHPDISVDCWRTHLPALLSEALGAGRIKYSNFFATRRYLTKFAELRGMIPKERVEIDCTIQQDLIEQDLIERDLLSRLLGWLVGQQEAGWSQTETEVLLPANFGAVQLVKDLIALGLQITLAPAPTPFILINDWNDAVVTDCVVVRSRCWKDQRGQ